MGWDGMGWDGMGWDGMGWDGMEPGMLSCTFSARPRGTSWCGWFDYGPKVSREVPCSSDSKGMLAWSEVASPSLASLSAPHRDPQVECCAHTPQYPGFSGVTERCREGCSSLVKLSSSLLPLLTRQQHSLGVQTGFPKCVFIHSVQSIHFCMKRSQRKSSTPVRQAAMCVSAGGQCSETLLNFSSGGR